MFPQTHAKPPALKEEATRLRVWIEGEARAAMADQRYAFQAGIAPVSAMPLLDASPVTATEAQWLRGAVQALLPEIAVLPPIDGGPVAAEPKMHFS